MAAKSRSALETLLKNSTDASVRACLLGSIKDASPEQVKELSALLAPLTAKSKNPEHCVRCHKEYRENENHSRACQIEHSDEGDGERTEIGDDHVTMSRSCCGDEWDGDEESDRLFCVEDFHTTNPNDVRYYDEDGYKEDGCNYLVIPCPEAGCSMKRKRVTNGDAASAKKKKAKGGI